MGDRASVNIIQERRTVGGEEVLVGVSGYSHYGGRAAAGKVLAAITDGNVRTFNAAYGSKAILGAFLDEDFQSALGGAVIPLIVADEVEARTEQISGDGNPLLVIDYVRGVIELAVDGQLRVREELNGDGAVRAETELYAIEV